MDFLYHGLAWPWDGLAMGRLAWPQADLAVEWTGLTMDCAGHGLSWPWIGQPITRPVRDHASPWAVSHIYIQTIPLPVQYMAFYSEDEVLSTVRTRLA